VVNCFELFILYFVRFCESKFYLPADINDRRNKFNYVCGPLHYIPKILICSSLILQKLILLDISLVYKFPAII
jgi:hypothetical protein